MKKKLNNTDAGFLHTAADQKTCETGVDLFLLVYGSKSVAVEFFLIMSMSLDSILLFTLDFLSCCHQNFFLDVFSKAKLD